MLSSFVHVLNQWCGNLFFFCDFSNRLMDGWMELDIYIGCPTIISNLKQQYFTTSIFISQLEHCRRLWSQSSNPFNKGEVLGLTYWRERDLGGGRLPSLYYNNMRKKNLVVLILSIMVFILLTYICLWYTV